MLHLFFTCLTVSFLILLIQVSSQCQSDLGCDGGETEGCMDKSQSCASDIYCRGNKGCYDGSQAYDVVSTAGTISCDGYISCFKLDYIHASVNVYCFGRSSCYDSNYIRADTGDIVCHSYRSCYSADYIYTVSGSVYCGGYESCEGSPQINSGSNVVCSGYQSCRAVALFESVQSKIECTGDESCASVTDMKTYDSTNGDIYCDSIYSCYYSNTITVGHTIYCRGFKSCTNIDNLIVAAGNIECTGKYSCQNTNMIMKTAANNVYCTNHYACSNTVISVLSILNDNNNIFGYGMMSLADATVNDNSTSDLNVYGYGIESFYQTQINKNNVDSTTYIYGICGLSFESSVITLNDKISNIYLYANQASYQSTFNINSVESSNIKAYGYYSAQLTTFNIETTIANFEFYGYKAGYNSTINCGVSSQCNIDCLGNGCDGLTLACHGTCIVSCDESQNIKCPNGYVGPTAAPSNLPTINPSNGPSNDPSLYPSQYPSSEPSNEPTMNPSSIPTTLPSVDPTAKPSNVPTMNPSHNPSKNPSNIPSHYPTELPSINPTIAPTGGINQSVVCSDIEQCMNVDFLYGNSVECSALRSCKNVGTIESNSDLLCLSSESCKDVTITHATNIYGYGFKSLENSLIDLSSFSISHEINIYLYGYESGNGANIICGNNAICNIYCKSDSCKNTTLVCNGECDINCDESKGINCALGDGDYNYMSNNISSLLLIEATNVEIFVDSIGTTGLFIIIVLFVCLLLFFICFCIWCIVNKNEKKINDARNNNHSKNYNINNNNNNNYQRNNNIIEQREMTKIVYLEKSIKSINAYVHKNEDLEAIFADLVIASPNKRNKANNNNNFDNNIDNIDNDDIEELYDIDNSNQDKEGDINAIDMKHEYGKSTTMTGETDMYGIGDSDNESENNDSNSKNDNNNASLVDELNVNNFKEWTQKEVLLWIKLELLENNFDKLKILNFLKELSTKNVTGGVIAQFKSNPKLLNAFIMQFTKENQNVGMWLLISLSIQALSSDNNIDHYNTNQ